MWIHQAPTLTTEERLSAMRLLASATSPYTPLLGPRTAFLTTRSSAYAHLR